MNKLRTVAIAGQSGAGKSKLATFIADILHCPFVQADYLMFDAVVDDPQKTYKALGEYPNGDGREWLFDYSSRAWSIEQERELVWLTKDYIEEHLDIVFDKLQHVNKNGFIIKPDHRMIYNQYGDANTVIWDWQTANIVRQWEESDLRIFVDCDLNKRESLLNQRIKEQGIITDIDTPKLRYNAIKPIIESARRDSAVKKVYNNFDDNLKQDALRICEMLR
jgi:cytidylate kinase